jgi:hypothetical protein
MYKLATGRWAHYASVANKLRLPRKGLDVQEY